MPRLLRDAGVSSHLISDHYHYWETGGATYHCQYASWQFQRSARPGLRFDTLLFDVQTDPGQQRPLDDARVERRMIEAMTMLMKQCAAPAEQFQRLGL